MRYTVLVRQSSPGKFVAIAPALPDCKGEGQTREEALLKLKNALETWLLEAEITSLEVTTPKKAGTSEANPWLATAGIFADDPMLDRLLQQVYQTRTSEEFVR